MSGLNQSRHDHAGEWDRFVIEARALVDAGRYAAARNWWLHCWTWEKCDIDHPVAIDTWGAGEGKGAPIPGT